MSKIKLCTFLLLLGHSLLVTAQTDTRIYDIINQVSAQRIEHDIRTLANFGTRHTLSDTLSTTRGIGAARRWIKAEFDKISQECGGCLDVFYQRSLVTAEGNRRFDKDTWVVNVVAIQKGMDYPDRYIIMSGDIDSRVSNVLNSTDDAPGANDNATGMAGTIEAARILSKYSFKNSIVYTGLSGEEQGLYGGKHMAKVAKEENWDIIGVINNDMIGNIEGIDGIIKEPFSRSRSSKCCFSSPINKLQISTSNNCVLSTI